MNVDLSIVIPIYNEEELIEIVVKDWVSVLNSLNTNYRLKLYNDGSTDNTISKLKKLKTLYPNNIDIVDKENSGHGPTILNSYIDSLDSEWIFQSDSDNEIKAHHFKEFWDLRHNNHFVIGNRINRNSSLFRRVMTHFSYLVVKLFYGKGVKDVNCPFRLMRTSKFEPIFKSIPKQTFAPNIIISGMAAKTNCNIQSVDIQFEARTAGESSLSSNIPKLLKISILSFLETIQYARKNS